MNGHARAIAAVAVAAAVVGCKPSAGSQKPAPSASVSASASVAQPAKRPPLCDDAIRCCHAVEKAIGEPCRESFQVPDGAEPKQCEFTIRGYRLKMGLLKKPIPAECPDKLADD